MFKAIKWNAWSGSMSAFSRGTLATAGRGVVYVALCVVLFLIGLIKGVFVGTIAAIVIFVGHMSVVAGLWPVHVVLTYNTIARTKGLGVVVKVFALLLLPIPLLLWPVLVGVGSVLVGLGYGFGTPLVATFEAVNVDNDSQFYRTFVDGTWSTITGSCTVVRDFKDLCLHSYCEYLNDFRVRKPKDCKPLDIKLVELPGCLAVAILGLMADIPLISMVALVKSPLMLFKGWERLLHDLVGHQDACIEAACVPFAGLALVLWPLVVVVSVLAAIVSSPLLGLFGAVIVYQEDSLRCGLAYIVSVVAEFDEYTNDVLNLNEGSCLPRPRYRKKVTRSDSTSANASLSPRSTESGIFSPSAVPQLTTSRSLRQQLQEVKVVQIWDNMFINIDMRGKDLVAAGVMTTTDLDGWLHSSKSPNSKVVAVGLPAYCTLHTLLDSARANSTGLLLNDGTEVTMFNRPQERMLDWFFEPLLTLKEQLRLADLHRDEEHYLEKLVFTVGDTARLLAWDNGGIEPVNDIRKGELQALSRRLQGISTSISRLPTYRRHFRNFIKSLLLYSLDRSGAATGSGSDGSLNFDETPDSSRPGSPQASSAGDESV